MSSLSLHTKTTRNTLLPLDSSDPTPWNALISSYTNSSLPKSALNVFDQMLQRGLVPNAFTFPSVLKACAATKRLSLGIQLHSRCLVSGLVSSLFVANSLIAMYSKNSLPCAARAVFDSIPVKDSVSWNSLLSAYASAGLWTDAYKVFDEMPATDTYSVAWNTIIGGKLKTGCFNHALSLISRMSENGVKMDFVTLVLGLNACSHTARYNLGKEIHAVALRTGWDISESVNNSLITMYSRLGNTRVADLLFARARTRSLVTWNCMVTGFAINDHAEEASMVFRDLVLSGLAPNYVTVVTLVALCARVSNLQHGRELHCYVIKNAYENYRLLWNSLVDMYSKSGKIVVAQKVFDGMMDRDEVTYTSLITGYGVQGEGRIALKLFDEMLACGIRPDNVSMVAVLSACSHSGLITEGQRLFAEMTRTYKIAPKMEHYSCMVDLYARAGLLDNAEKMLDEMPMRPSVEIWAALTSACLVSGNTRIGERAAKRLLETGTENAGHYVLIANMYAATGCWEELARVRMMMRDSGVRKVPGLAWADLGNGFRPFSVADRSSALAPEIYAMLDGLSEQMRGVGRGDGEEFVVCEEIWCSVVSDTS